MLNTKQHTVLLRSIILIYQVLSLSNIKVTCLPLWLAIDEFSLTLVVSDR